LLKINIKDMKKIKLALTGIVCLTIFVFFFGLICRAQKNPLHEEYVCNLHVPQLYKDMENILYAGFDYTFRRIEQHVSETHRKLKRSDIEKVSTTAIYDFCDSLSHVMELDSATRCFLLQKNKPNDIIKINPHLKPFIKEIRSVKFDLKGGLSQFENQLDAINLKAASTLSEKDANIIYSITSVSMYSAKYWAQDDMQNAKKWLKLIKNARKRRAKQTNINL
jgi:hypothetical protein